ncbi:MAG: hypothetical protein KA314_20070 [Chloroflexi bacterium]|nr:hypothetical protein [Chloroflexota bacterium]MBP8058134.1 hypothetical protein [Chloroflexota bacterium]
MRRKILVLPFGRILFFTFLLAAAVLTIGLSQNVAAIPDDPSITPNDLEATLELPGQSISQVTGAPLALYGVNYPVAAATPEEMARQYLRAHAATLHLKTTTLDDLIYRIMRQGPSGTVVRFTQQVDGVPVYQAEIAVHINNQSMVTAVTSQYKEGAELNSTVPTLAAAAAHQLAVTHLNAQAPFGYDSNTLVVYHNANNNETRLAYQIRLEPSAPLGYWELLVDAHSGDFIKVVNLAAEADDDKTPQLVDGTGYIFDPDPLSSAQATYGDPGFTDGNDATTTQLDGERVTVTLKDIQFDGTNYTLIGPWAEVTDFESPFNGLFAQPSSTFNYNRFDNAFEVAHTYYHIDNVMRYLNLTLGLGIEPSAYPGGVLFDPHGLNGDDNSHYLGGSQRVAFGEGGVDDAEDADVVIHELGHGLHDWVTNGGLSQVNGLSEGIGDYVAQSYSRSLGQWDPGDPQYNWVFDWDGHNSFWGGRITNYTAIWPGGLIGQIHTDGQIWATCMMKVWNAVGRDLTEMAHWEGIGMTNSTTNQNVAANAVFQAAIDLNYPTATLQAMRTQMLTCGYSIPEIPVPDFAMGATPANQSVCVGNNAVYDVQVSSLLGYNQTVVLNASGNPAGTTTAFSPASGAAPYTSTLTIGNTSAAAPGSYSINIVGVAPTATHTTTVGLTLADIPTTIALTAPANGATGQSLTPTFQWQANAAATSYTLEVAHDNLFTHIIYTVSGLTGTSHTATTALDPEMTHYWRVRGVNSCGIGVDSSTYSFTTRAAAQLLYLPFVLKP